MSGPYASTTLQLIYTSKDKVNYKKFAPNFEMSTKRMMRASTTFAQGGNLFTNKPLGKPKLTFP